MSVIVDDQTLDATELGLTTVGQVLQHVQRENRLVTQLLIDGQEPELNHLPQLRRSPLNGKTIYIETTEPHRIAAEVLDEMDNQIEQTEQWTREAVELLRGNQQGRAMEKLSACFCIWQHVQDSIGKVSQLLRIDLDRLQVDGRPCSQVLNDFVQQLRSLKGALENRDFVSLTDILAYEITETSSHWRAAIRTLRNRIPL